MPEEGFKRKLTAVLSADVEGYSRLMGEDEGATVRTLTAYRKVMTALIQQHNGKVLDSPGDNLLAEFVSVVDAVQCAVAVQKEIKARNEELSESRRMQFRIGINLGDVIQEKGRIYGDGVNIAARLEGLSEPGGICISKTAFDHIESKLPYGYEFLGDQNVKNIARPVGAYRVLMEPRVTVAEISKQEKPSPSRRTPIFIGIIAVMVVVVAVGVWQLYMRRPLTEAASAKEMAYPLPDKPSIAVLPFANMSDDPKQEYFCDGITEDLITDLSKISDLFIIARNSTFAYKGKPVKIKQVAEDLGVRFVLEGSVRKAANQVRITAQLIDATTGSHLWADRYTGSIDDVFAFQDKITQKIVDALAIKLNVDEQVQLARKDTDNITAYDQFLKGWEHYLRWTPEDFFKAISFFEKAVQIDSNYGRAYAALAATYWQGSKIYLGLSQFGVSKEEGLLVAREYLEKAMKNPTSLAYYLASEMDLYGYQWQEALVEAERGIALEPNNEIINLQMGYVLIMSGDPKKGVNFIKKAMRLNPHYSARALYLQGLAHFCMEDFEKAITLLERSHQLNPDMREPAIFIAISYALLGHDDDARRIAADLHKKWPTQWILLYYIRDFPFKNPQVANRFAEGYLKSGLSIGGSPEYFKILDENRLTDQQIRALVFSQKIIGLEVGSGSGGYFERNIDGKANYRGLITGSDSGKSWIENELLCDQWEKRFGGHKICYPVFRNPEGKPENRDEYLAIYDWGIFTFSVLD